MLRPGMKFAGRLILKFGRQGSLIHKKELLIMKSRYRTIPHIAFSLLTFFSLIVALPSRAVFAAGTIDVMRMADENGLGTGSGGAPFTISDVDTPTPTDTPTDTPVIPTN